MALGPRSEEAWDAFGTSVLNGYSGGSGHMTHNCRLQVVTVVTKFLPDHSITPSAKVAQG